jgi:uncharacterized protein (DUF1697 family)
MTRYIAFLRAINVGGHVVKMDELRRLFEVMGFSKVETFIASGNVIFDSSSKNAAALETKIAGGLHKALGYEVVTFLRTSDELTAVAQYQPFPKSEAAANDATLYIGFLAAELTREASQKLMTFKTASDDFRANGREFYWLRNGPSSDSEFSLKVFEKKVGVQSTLRNSTTVRKMADKYGG